MKYPLRLLLSAAAWLASCTWITAGEIYYGPVTPGEVASALIGNHPDAQVGSGSDLIKLRAISGPGLGDSSSPGGITLTQAAISPVTASPLGYATHETNALAAAASSLQAAAAYRNSHNQNGLWDIQFAGVPPKTNPPPQNFLPGKIDEAVASARAAIRANPYRTGPGSGYALLFQAAYETTVPHTWSGNEWRAKAEKDRLGVTVGGPGNASIDTRLTSLQTACDRYRVACRAFLALLNHEVESAWLLHPENVNGYAGPSWMPETITVNGTQRKRWTWPKLLYQAYVEAVTQLAQSEFERLYTRYLKDYGAGDLSALIAEIHARADEIDRLILPVSAIRAANPLTIKDPENPPNPLDPGANPLDPEIDTGSPASYSALLRRLADHAVERSLFFSPGVNPFSGTVSYSTYGPNYVPFLVPAQLASRPFSFDNFLAFTHGISTTGDGSISPTGYLAQQGSLINDAINADTTAAGLVEAVIQNTTDLDNLFEDTRTTYEGQLKQLCGQRRTGSGNTTVPDILGYLLPTEERDPLLQNETFGDIALQWNKIEQAETRLFSAYRALAEIDEEATIIRQYGNERLLSYDRIAKIQLNTGEQISALDYLSGEIRAKAIEAEAEERAKQAEKKSWFGAAFKWIAHGVAAIATGGTSLAYTAFDALTLGIEAASDVGAVVDGLKQAENEAEMHRNIGRIQADATRRQAEIAAQHTKIRAVEGASITIENATQEDNRIREAIHKLMIRVERQKLEILLAQQQLEFAEIEHANMLGRISTLIEEYRKASIRNAANTLNRPDVRLHRDYEIQEAARKFRVAQEYAFLCAKAAHYRFTGKPSDTFQAQVAVAEANILKAQNGKQLEAAVSSLITIRGQFLNATGGMAPLQEIRFSIRDLVVQSNHWLAAYYRQPNGTWTSDLVSTDLQGFPQSIAPTATAPGALSDAEFVQYLQERLKSDPDAPGSSRLQIRFPIGFEPSFSGRTNPLRTNTTGQYGHVIEGPGPSYASAAAVGVFVNIRNNRSINPIGLMPSTASLKPIGSFYTTSTPQGAPTAPINIGNYRVWNPSEKQGGTALNNSVQVLYNRDTLASWSLIRPDLTLGSAGSQLHERSPANDHWLLEIVAEEGVWNVFLPNMRDIEICMTIRGWSN